MRCISAQGHSPAARRDRCIRSHPNETASADPGRRRLSLLRRSRRFAREEAGAVTVEAVIWIPFFFFILALITDASLAFFAKAEAFRIIQAGNRLYSIEQDKDANTAAELETWIENAFESRSANANATTTLVEVSTGQTVVSTALTIPIREVMLFDAGVPDSWVMTVGSQHYVEWPNG